MVDERKNSEQTMHESVHVKGILIGGLCIAGAIGFALLAAFGAIHLGSNGSPHLAAHPGKPLEIEGQAVLQVHPAEDIRAFRAQKQQLLDSYEWVDREHTIARIPIERAMELLAAESKP